MVSMYSEKDKKRRSAPQRAQGGKRHAGQKAEGVKAYHLPVPNPKVKGFGDCGISLAGRITEKVSHVPRISKPIASQSTA